MSKAANKTTRRLTRVISMASAAVVVPMLLTAALASPAAASADPEWAPVYEYLSSYGVPQATQEAVVAKIQAGEIPDSLKAGATPVTSYEELFPDSQNLVEKFADGSVKVTALELPAEEAGETGNAARAITGCTYTSGTGYSNYANCSVNIVTEMVTTKFVASYSRNPQFGQITAASTPQVLAHYGSASTPSLTTIRSKSSGGLEALVQLHSRFTSHTGASSEDLYLSLRVNASTAWSTNY